MKTLTVILLSVGSIEGVVISFMANTMPIMQWCGYAFAIVSASCAIVKVIYDIYSKMKRNDKTDNRPN